MFGFLRHRRRRKLLAEPFPAHWLAILQRNVAHYHHLPADHQARLRDITRVFIAEKSWEGCRSLHVTEEMQVTVAGQAGLLLLGHGDHDYYRRVPSIVLYPDEFRTPVEEDGWEDDELSDSMLSGQAVYRGPVILSWKEVLEEGRDPGCGHNVVIHEFAHQLDYLDNSVDGTPNLPSEAAAERWRIAFNAALERHRHLIDSDESEYFFSEQAAESETEFFADATEAFFCSPAGLREIEPAVYSVLAEYFSLDPVTWFPDVR